MGPDFYGSVHVDFGIIISNFENSQSPNILVWMFSACISVPSKIKIKIAIFELIKKIRHISLQNYFSFCIVNADINVGDFVRKSEISFHWEYLPP